MSDYVRVEYQEPEDDGRCVAWAEIGSVGSASFAVAVGEITRQLVRTAVDWSGLPGDE